MGYLISLMRADDLQIFLHFVTGTSVCICSGISVTCSIKAAPIFRYLWLLIGVAYIIYKLRQLQDDVAFDTARHSRRLKWEMTES